LSFVENLSGCVTDEFQVVGLMSLFSVVCLSVVNITSGGYL